MLGLLDILQFIALFLSLSLILPSSLLSKISNQKCKEADTKSFA